MSTTDQKHSPRRFYTVNVLLLILGVLIWFVNPSCLQSLRPITAIIKPDSWGHFLSIYIFSIPFYTLIVFWIMEFLSCLLNVTRDIPSKPAFTADDNRANFWSPIIVGYAELIMYPLAFVFGRPDFIAAWLVLKVAGQWAGWKGIDPGIELSLSRWRYNRFIVGNALNIIAAALTYALMKIVGVFV